MQKLLGVALGASLALLPMSAYAADTAQGVVRSADIFSGVLVIKTEGGNAREMSFDVPEKLNFFELFLNPGDRVRVEFDSAQCAGKADCMPSALKIGNAS